MGAEQEQVWVLQARRGDPEAFAKIVEAYQVPVYNLAYRMLGNSAEAEDASQETFIRAYTRLETYDPTRKFSSWVLSIASHHCIDRLRRRRGGTISMEETLGQRWIPDEAPKPEEQTLKGEQRDMVCDLLADLPPQYRLALVLRYWHDLSYEEIAEMTDSSVSAIKSRLHRARGMVARRLEERDGASAAKRGERRVRENAVP